MFLDGKEQKLHVPKLSLLRKCLCNRFDNSLIGFVAHFDLCYERDSLWCDLVFKISQTSIRVLLPRFKQQHVNPIIMVVNIVVITMHHPLDVHDHHAQFESSLPPPYSVPHSLTVPCRQLSTVGLSYLAIIKYKCLICNHCWQFGCITSSSRWRRLTELKPGGKRWVGCRRKISKELEMLSLPCHSLLESHYEIAVQNYQCVKGHKSKAQRSQVSRIISWVIDANQQTCTPTI